METFDYVIVGAGSAGCVLADRLSAGGDRSVLLLEAGGSDDASIVQQPSQWPAIWDSAFNWGYSTTLQPGLGSRSILCPRGKGLGGSGSINAMLYVRGNPQDYDHWAAQGNPGWGWSDVKPYFLKAEHQQRGASAWHGVGGPLHVADQLEPSALSHAFIAAATEAGHPANDDFNGPSQLGAGLYQVTQREGQRWSTAAGYLRPAMARPNLTVRTGARVLRLQFRGNTATGLSYFDGHAVREVAVSKELVLSAGAIDSPRLLMLSGVGKPSALEPLGIRMQVALPAVGEHLCDHQGSPVVYALRQAAQAAPSSVLVEAGLFMRSRRATTGYDSDLQFFTVPFLPTRFAVAGPTRLLAIVAQACRPSSRGRVTLRSSDPFDTPLIDPAYLSDPEDLQLQVEGVREARRIAEQEPLRSMLAAEMSPGPAVQDDASLAAALRMSAMSIWHPVGTCRMGPAEGAVVDAQLRVHGVERLRVVDASVMPQITSGNTHAPTVMIAEKAADLILAA